MSILRQSNEHSTNMPTPWDIVDYKSTIVDHDSRLLRRLIVGHFFPRPTISRLKIVDQIVDYYIDSRLLLPHDSRLLSRPCAAHLTHRVVDYSRLIVDWFINLRNLSKRTSYRFNIMLAATPAGPHRVQG